MLLYTSSFFDFATQRESKRCVSIALRAPRERKLYTSEVLLPSWKIVNNYKRGVISKEKYTEEYYKLLRERLLSVWNEIINGDAGEDILTYFNLKDGDCMLCWEAVGEFCHRRLVASLLEKNNIPVIIK